MIKLYVGIDPGLSGAMGLINNRGYPLHVVDVPIMAKSKGGGFVKNCINAKGVFDILANWKAQYPFDMEVWMENVASRPTDGAAGAFSFGDTFGSLKAAVACSNLPLNLVTPAAWKKSFKLPSADKEVARAHAINLFPDVSEYLQRKMDHNRAEALLIALYGVNQNDN